MIYDVNSALYRSFLSSKGDKGKKKVNVSTAGAVPNGSSANDDLTTIKFRTLDFSHDTQGGAAPAKAGMPSRATAAPPKPTSA
ncbi:hypothetical protein QOT17_011533 [Balamuthia mandrillaris]